MEGFGSMAARSDVVREPCMRPLLACGDGGERAERDAADGDGDSELRERERTP
jgi:hypothetical protein